MKGHHDTVKVQKMADMYRQGLTYTAIASHFGCTRQNIQQCIRPLGIKFTDGGQHRQVVAKRTVRVDAMEARCLAKYGHSRAVMAELRKTGVVRDFQQQIYNAKNRGIRWSLSFKDWYCIWETSGKLNLRGKGKGHYVMSRLKDCGAYELGNVHIQLGTENSRDGRLKAVRKSKDGVGVYHQYPGLSRGWIAKYCNKTIGLFASEADAVQARKDFLAKKKGA